MRFPEPGRGLPDLDGAPAYKQARRLVCQAHRAGIPPPARPEDLPRRRRPDPPAFREGQKDQLAALGLVVNAVALWNTRYLSTAIDQLRVQGVPVKDEDVARLSPLGHAHINFLGRYAITASAPPKAFGSSAKSQTCPVSAVEPKACAVPGAVHPRGITSAAWGYGLFRLR
jgi:Tn3 transposase DDE domain